MMEKTAHSQPQPDQIEIGPGEPVTGAPNGVASGVLGVFVADLTDPEGARVYALTARSVARSNDCVSTAQGAQVGRAFRVNELTNAVAPRCADGTQEAWNLLTFVRLDDNVLIDPSGLPDDMVEPDFLTTDAVDVLGKPVRRADGDAMRLGRVKRAESGLVMTGADGAEQRYAGAALIRPESIEHPPFAGPGDAGTGVLCNETGGLVGIVVSGTPTETVIAPVHRLLQQMRYAPLTRRAASAYNRIHVSVTGSLARLLKAVERDPDQWEALFDDQLDACTREFQEISGGGGHEAASQEVYMALFEPLMQTSAAARMRADLSEPTSVPTSEAGREALILMISFLDETRQDEVRKALDLVDDLMLVDAPETDFGDQSEIERALGPSLPEVLRS